MTEQSSEREAEHPFLANVQKGMQVIDLHGANVGMVEQVYQGLPRGDQRVTDTKQVVAIEQEVFGGDQLPGMLRTRLLEQGFIRAADRYLMPEQIDRIEGNQIYLRVPLDQTIDR